MSEKLSKPMTLKTALGPGVLDFKSMRATEELGRLFEYEVMALSVDAAVDVVELLGKPATVSVDLGDGAKRHFNGIVASAGLEGPSGRFQSYRLTLRPWLWLLTRAADVRIFQDKSVPDIIKEVFNDAGFSDFVVNLSASYSPRGYCVQYRETTFDFVSRLMEECGIYYFFRHTDGKHELVLADEGGVHVAEHGLSKLPFREFNRHNPERGIVTSWRFSRELRSGVVTLRDFNYETPAADLTAQAKESRRMHALASLEVYDAPGRYAAKAAGDGLAKTRLEEQQARFGAARGETPTPALMAGARFKLDGHKRGDQNVEHVVLSMRLEMALAGYESGDADDTRAECSFSAFDAKETFRSESRTPKPRVAGPQTATVVGPGGEEIHTDKYGRVKLQFHWDRLGKKDEKSSLWVRVAQPAAGKQFGMVWLPRIGQEVVVDFLEGDPDQPLVTGSVYNAANMPPYALPDKKSVSTIKSNSTKGGGGYNEIRFDDLKGKEYVLDHVQKDKFEFIKDTLRSQIDKDEHRTVKGDRKEKIDGEHHVQVGKGAKHKVGAKWSMKAAEDMLLESGAMVSLKSATDVTAQSGTAISLKSGTDMHLKIGTNLGADAGVNVHLKGGVNVVIEAGVMLTLKVGGSSVVLTPANVSITGGIVMINSGGGPGAGSGASPVATKAPEAPKDPEPPKDPIS